MTALTWSTRGLKEDPHAWWASTIKRIQEQAGLNATPFAHALGVVPKVAWGWTTGKIPRHTNAISTALERIGVGRASDGTSISVALEQAQAASAKIKSALCATRPAQQSTGKTRTVQRMEKARERACIRCSVRTQFRTPDGQPLCPLCVKEDPLTDEATT